MSLTPDQLAAIKARCTREKVDLPTSGNGKLRCYVAPAIDLDALLGELERLANENASLSHAYDTRAMSWGEELVILRQEVQRLTRHNQRMTAALAQLSDSDHWLEAMGSDNEPSYIWLLTIDPQQLAERALVEDN